MTDDSHRGFCLGKNFEHALPFLSSFFWGRDIPVAFVCATFFFLNAKNREIRGRFPRPRVPAIARLQRAWRFRAFGGEDIPAFVPAAHDFPRANFRRATETWTSPLPCAFPRAVALFKRDRREGRSPKRTLRVAHGVMFVPPLRGAGTFVKFVRFADSKNLRHPRNPRAFPRRTIFRRAGTRLRGFSSRP